MDRLHAHLTTRERGRTFGVFVRGSNPPASPWYQEMFS